ncbi:hypothetical protein Pmani_004090 [Petrolisthes manimaculis]|uniref:non-specific serine/threonine protein kinase n=1 Tax=Petrolisthes manimaculis TaxID=1843537 RepID=A0AAE1QES2_9EUCA|nr:hypothetical protein Pmani_004090 [Petrolisthes manimaculis]
MAKVSETKTIPRNQLENLRKSEVVDMIITMRDDEGTANITKKLSETLLQFFPDAWLTTATDISLVLHLLDLFWGLIWTCSIIEPGSSACHLAHTWLALATLPWMVTEVKLMDLKLVNARQFTHWSAKLKWNEDVRVKSKSIRVIAVLPGNVAPSLDESTLVGLIEEVVAVMKPLVKKRPEEMAPVLTSVLVETPSVKEFLANMPLLPEDDSLSIINQAILEHQLKVVGVEVRVNVLHQATLQPAGHESVEVRVNALHRLRHNQPAIHLLTTQSDNVHTTISELFTVILKVLNEIHLNIESELFIVQLVTELGRTFLAATDANTQTCASYAMLEVTRLYGIRESGSGEATPIGSQAWEKLPYHLQEMIYPLLTSKYTLSTGNNRSSVTLPSPIFGSDKAKTFQQWLTSWECSLVDLLQGERASQVFSACKPILCRDTTTAIYLLPSILICMLCETSDHHHQITTQVLSVMNQLQEKDKEEAALSIISIEIKQLAVLDYLSKWSQKKRQAETQGKKGRAAFVPSTQLHQVMSFLEKIPADILAHISYQSHAYSPALMHIEAYIKDNPLQVKEHLCFLQVSECFVLKSIER